METKYYDCDDCPIFSNNHDAWYRKSNDEIAELEQEWRQLYPVARADYLRFMQGWNPDNWKINSDTEAMAEQGLKQLSLSIA